MARIRPLLTRRFTKRGFKIIGCLLVSGILLKPQSLLADEGSPTPYYGNYDDLLRYGYDDSWDYGNSQPSTQRLRLEIDLSHRQLILYEDNTRVKSYSVAVGRQGWRTPVGNFEVIQMIHDPSWTNPFTGRVIGGGDPENPLGRYWIGFWTDGHNWVGMHGTPNPESVGREASHGCIRLYNRDIQELFTLVRVGTPIEVVP
jgi:hypothetical protein